VRGPTDAERAHIFRTIASMHWSVHVSYEGSKAVEMRRRHCGLDRPSLCLLPDKPTTRFAYMRPEDGRDPVPADVRFLRACGVRPPRARWVTSAGSLESRVLDLYCQPVPAVPEMQCGP